MCMRHDLLLLTIARNGVIGKATSRYSPDALFHESGGLTLCRVGHTIGQVYDALSSYPWDSGAHGDQSQASITGQNRHEQRQVLV